ncbi:MAG: hypothetical protein JNK12_05405 [Acidimicrobiales bacterium]|nr:hypothetical protein [Acidimicrobiales bacterium]
MPTGPPDGWEEGYVALGGCVVTGDDPSHLCGNCGSEFWADGRVRIVEGRRSDPDL